MPFCVGVAIRFLSFQSLKAGSWRNYFILPLQESSLSLCLCTRVPRDSTLHPPNYLYIICLKKKSIELLQVAKPTSLILSAWLPKTLPVGSKVNHPDNIFCFLMIQLLLAHCLLSSLFPHLSVWCSCSNTFINLASPVVTYILSHVLLCNLMDYSPWLLSPWDFPARILKWVAISSSRGPSQLRDWTHMSCIASGFYTTGPQGKPTSIILFVLSSVQED